MPVELLEARVFLSSSGFDVKLEAENATLSGPLVQTNHTGYSGTGFLNFQANGNYAQWTVNVPSTGSYLLDFRYANGGSTNRPMSISVSSTVVNASQAFNPTTNWDTWSDSTLTVALQTGNNMVTATEVGSSAPNLDYLNVSGQGSVTIPTAPSGLSATPSALSSQINLTWTDNSNNETGFTVDEATNSTFTSGLVSSNVAANTPSFTATGLSAGTTYYFRVEATNSAGSSAYSAPASATTTASSVWPDATNTGPTNSKILVTSGSITVTTNGAVIQNVNVTGSIDIEASNVTIKNFIIHPTGSWGIRIYSGFSNALIEDGEIAGSGTTLTDGIDYANYTALRLNIHNVIDGMKANGNATIEDCYIHDLYAITGSDGKPTHNDGIQDDGGSHVIVEHNNIQRPNVGNSCFQISCDLGPIDDFLIEDNLLNGGGYTISCGSAVDGAPTNVRVIGNFFGRDYIWGLKLPDGTVTQTWTDNEWADNDTPAPDGTTVSNLTVTVPYDFAANTGSGIKTITETSIDIISSGSAKVDSATNHANRTLLVTSSLTFDGSAGAWQGKLDMTSNDLIVHGGNLANVQNQLQAGFNAPGGYWNGSAGIVSTAAANDTRHLTTLGYRTGGSPFDGANTSSTDVLVKYTYYGDTNLDGVVNGADYQQIDNGFGMHLTGWQNGDFNYDGVVDGSDFSLIDNAFNQLNTTGASPLVTLAAGDTVEITGNAQASRKSPAPSQRAQNQTGNPGIFADGNTVGQWCSNSNVEDLIDNGSSDFLKVGRKTRSRIIVVN